MKIKIKFMNSESKIYDFDGTTITELRKVIEDDMNKKIKLVFAGKILKDGETIEQHKISDNTTIIGVISKNPPATHLPPPPPPPILPTLPLPNIPPLPTTPTANVNPLTPPQQPNFTNVLQNLMGNISNTAQSFNSSVDELNNLTQLYQDNPSVGNIMSSFMNNDVLRNQLVDSVLQNMRNRMTDQLNELITKLFVKQPRLHRVC